MSALETDTINAKGHPNIKAQHKTTLEVTTEDYVTHRGDCIIAVAADKAAADINPRLLAELALGYSLAIAIEAGSLIDVFFAQGAPGHTPSSKTSIVIRRSTYLDDRTLAVHSTKAARDIDRKLAAKLRELTTVTIYLATAPTRREALKALTQLL